MDAVRSVLADRALQWYRSLGNESLTLRDFIAQLRDQFVRRLDREDLYKELRARTQAPEECARDFLASVRCIVARFDCPPSAAKQLRIVLRNLHPEFRHFLETKDVRELEDIRRFGLEFERRKELDARRTATRRARSGHRRKGRKEEVRTRITHRACAFRK